MTVSNAAYRSRSAQRAPVCLRFPRMVKLPRPAEPEPELPEPVLSPRSAAWIRLIHGLHRLARLRRIWANLGAHLRAIKGAGRADDAA